MIFARDKSQMCNNLLQYAHVYAWGREHGRKVISMRFSYKYKFFKISHSNLVSFPLYLFAKYMAALKLLPTASFKHEDCNREALEQMMLRHRNIVVAGWNVRFYDLFIKYIDEIRELFTIDSRFSEAVEEKFHEIEKGDDILRLGVHIRRGDYINWKDGVYYYDDEVYCNHIKKFLALFPEKNIYVYLSTNDPSVEVEVFRKETHHGNIYNLQGNAPEDLHMLSKCDYIIGPPSTFSIVASMYGKALIYRMETKDESGLKAEAFHDFNYWFRRLI